ncbi:MAG: threonine synthase [Acidobacteriales bacterium]|nr:threonine synthase [Terriglobales bacterium]
MNKTAGVPAKSNAPQLRCIGCATVAITENRDMRCSGCGDLLEVIYPALGSGIDAESLKTIWQQRRTSNHSLDTSGVWRFREMLPALTAGTAPITLREGNTPLYELPLAARKIGIGQLFAKHQGMNPTGSFKDTGMTVAASFARQHGYRWVACASTGNTSASMAAYASRGKMRSLVLVPEGQVSWSKLSQALDYGALTCQLRTDFDGCTRVLNAVIQRAPIYVLNSVNPHRVEGQKTAAIELLEQLDWEAPDHVIVPGGNLANSSALGKAFLEMKDIGLTSRLPRISIIQAEGANALVRTMRENSGQQLIPVEAQTHATAIRIGNPASWKKAVRVLQATGGSVEQVSEAEIALAKAEIGAEGIGCEPASAVTLAGLKKLVKRGIVKSQERAVLILTGHLLKDSDYTLKYHLGELFSGADTQDEGLDAQRRRPLVLDATPDIVLNALEAAEKMDIRSEEKQ